MKLMLNFLIITSISVFAQSSKLDSLENLLAKGQSDTTKINLTFEIAIESSSTAPEKTLANAEKVLAMSKKIGYKKGEADGQYALGVYYWQKNKYPEAIAHYYRAQELARANGIGPALQLAYEGLAGVYGQTGNYANAFRFQKLAMDLKDSLFNEENTIKMTNLRVQHKLQEKQIKLLKKERDRGDAARNMIMVGLLVVLIVVAQTSNRQRRKEAKNKELHTAQKALADIEIQNSLEKEQHLTNELQFRNKALTTHTLNLIQKNSILEDIRETVTLALKSAPKDQNTPLFSKLINLIDYSFNLDKDWDEFKTYFEGVHPNFFSTLKSIHPELSAGDLRLCALVRLNLNLKESAGLLNISPDSVKTARHRIRKKLKLSEENNLLEYLMRI